MRFYETRDSAIDVKRDVHGFREAYKYLRQLVWVVWGKIGSPGNGDENTQRSLPHNVYIYTFSHWLLAAILSVFPRYAYWLMIDSLPCPRDSITFSGSGCNHLVERLHQCLKRPDPIQQQTFVQQQHTSFGELSYVNECRETIDEHILINGAYRRSTEKMHFCIQFHPLEDERKCNLIISASIWREQVYFNSRSRPHYCIDCRKRTPFTSDGWTFSA